MARHDDDVKEITDKNLGTGEVVIQFMLSTETDCSPAERDSLRTAAQEGAGALDAWYAALPTSDDRRAWWASRDGTTKNKWREGFKFGNNAPT